MKPLLCATLLAAGALLHAQNRAPADLPAPRADENSRIAHQQLLEKAASGGIDVYFVGDSITRRWGATDYPELLANWKDNFFGWNAADFGWGADRTENILWRLENGELDGVHPKVIVILAGTNNIGATPGGPAKIAEITRGVGGIVHVCRQKAPAATIIVTAIFPRNDNIAVMTEIDAVNESLERIADGRIVRYLNVNDKLADRNGRLLDGMMNPRDKLHPTLKGYQVWADGLKPILRELLGPPASTDHAPPPTGDPSVRGRGAQGLSLNSKSLAHLLTEGKRSTLHSVSEWSNKSKKEEGKRKKEDDAYLPVAVYHAAQTAIALPPRSRRGRTAGGAAIPH